MGWQKRTEELLANKRVLVVGAGGIGCELLKNLVLARFANIHVIDLDTIDVSNLNRQFLFRRQHVGRSKAEVAVEAVREALGTVTDAKITYDHDSIFKSQFGLAFFQGFDLIMNALDNRAARNHVNRLCIAARVPLIESGTAGYLGQVRLIVRDVTPCYECVYMPAEQKTFPGCTIRNTPSEHIHCTVWAKHVFNQLFGDVDFDDEVSPDATDTGKRDEEGREVKGDSEPMEQDGVTNGAEKNGDVKEEPASTRKWAEENNYEPKKIFQKLFEDDIKYLLSMEHLWKERRPPKPLHWDDIPDSSRLLKGVAVSTEVWTVGECVDFFAATVNRLRERKAALPPDEVLTWDKDDDDAMQFVAACANLRATIFSIPTKSLFEIKSMAGNIIPAIATTNAIIAGMIVVEAIKLLQNKDAEKLKELLENRKLSSLRFLKTSANPRGELLATDVGLIPPNPNCFVCAEQREIFVRINTQLTTLKSFVEKVLKGTLNMLAPDVVNGSTQSVIVSSEEGECDELLPKKLNELGLGDGSLLECDDFQQQLSFRLGVFSNEKLKEDEFEVLRDSTAKAEQEKVEEDTRKRQLPEDADAEAVAKKARIEA